MNENSTTPCVNETSETIQIPISRGLFATIDREDYERVTNNGKWKWTALPTKWTTYVRRNVWKDGKQHSLYLHRFIMGDREGFEVDHIDSNGLNCSKANMRFATKHQNAQNQRIKKNNKSGHKGVGWSKGSQQWQAYITIHRRMIHLGYFNTKEEAVAARVAAAKMAHQEFYREK